MRYLFILVTFSITPNLFSQNTLGIIQNNLEAYNGYTLFGPNNSTETYLINNCGEVVHQWSSTYTPAASVYLLENGNLLRTGKISNTEITFGGVGGKIELFDWDNNLLWEYTYSSTLMSQHHDIYPLPDGNVLMLAVDTILEAEAINAGRNPSLISEGKIFNEQIIELEPILGTNTANIVWEWNIKDHLIQDHDITKANYGVVANHPELLDFNFLNNNSGNANWLHINSLQYNASLDQIILSSRLLSEIYIIDHSTTTLEASTNDGGIYGKGGDFLYRWGNPVSYNMGDETNQTLFSQHYPHWISEGLVDEGKIMVFNNGNSIRFSSVDIFTPPTVSPGVYQYDSALGYGPISYDWTYIDPIDPENFFSAILSSVQRLPNGNTLVCDGDSGYFFELNPSNTTVWEYINPDTNNGILSQGDTPSANLVFRALKFSPDFPAFTGRDLTPGLPIELNPDISACENLSITDVDVIDLKLYPNPTSNFINITSIETIDKVELYSILGKKVLEVNRNNSIDISAFNSGIYFVKIHSGNRTISKKIIKK
ncbi:MAG: hypothetical protein ACI9OT_001204 [Gammaproteobacteria bacterium]|jgi:hypothetical protein